MTATILPFLPVQAGALNVALQKDTSTCRQPGFSLIEVLVALVILSVGMLGILTLQVKGLQFSQTAMSNTQAVILASDMIDRIRANSIGITNYNVGFAGADAALPQPICGDLNGNAVGGTCTPAQLAVFDVWQWKTSLEQASLMPSATGSVAIQANNRAVTITMLWLERGEQKQHQVRFSL